MRLVIIICEYCVLYLSINNVENLFIIYNIIFIFFVYNNSSRYDGFYGGIVRIMNFVFVCMRFVIIVVGINVVG